MSEMQTDIGPIVDDPVSRELAEKYVLRKVGYVIAPYYLQALGFLEYERKPMPHRWKPAKGATK